MAPSGLHAAHWTWFAWPRICDNFSPVFASHTMKMLSADPEKIRSPDRLQATDVTPSVSPLNSDIILPVSASQTMSVLSYDPETSLLPSGLHEMHLTVCACPFSFEIAITALHPPGGPGRDRVIRPQCKVAVAAPRRPLAGPAQVSLNGFAQRPPWHRDDQGHGHWHGRPAAPPPRAAWSRVSHHWHQSVARQVTE